MNGWMDGQMNNCFVRVRYIHNFVTLCLELFSFNNFHCFNYLQIFKQEIFFLRIVLLFTSILSCAFSRVKIEDVLSRTTIQSSTVLYSTIQYNTLRYNTVHYNAVQYNKVQYNKVQYNTVQYRFSGRPIVLLSVDLLATIKDIGPRFPILDIGLIGLHSLYWILLDFTAAKIGSW